MKSERLRALSVSSTSSTSSEVAALGSTRLDHWALGRIQQAVAPAPLRFELWDGYAIGPDHTPIATLTVKNRPALYKWLWNPDLNFGEGYMSGAVEVRGDLVEMLVAVYRAMGDSAPRPWWMPEPGNSVHASRENVHHHYDIGNEFYRLWLDERMLYTCAYFPTPDATLEDAQIAKMALISRKLRLRPGERVVEAGCGWGSLALFMAREHGVHVTAFNISREQIAYAREQAKAQGLADLVDFIEDDYRNVRGQCDAFVSVGMLEHVGLPDYATLGSVMDRVLREDGRGLLHFIGRNKPAPLNPWITKRIFPGAYPPTLVEVFERILQPSGFSVLDVENIRLHYAKTLEHWRARFLNATDRVTEMFDEAFVRAWDLYLAGSEVAFVTGSLQLFQVVFARAGTNAIPWTRTSA